MLKSKSRKKKQPKRVLALPDLEHARRADFDSQTSSRRLLSMARPWGPCSGYGRERFPLWTITCDSPQRISVDGGDTATVTPTFNYCSV